MREVIIFTSRQHNVPNKFPALQAQILPFWLMGEWIVRRKIMSRKKYVNQLTDRELEVLNLLAEGWNNKRIADELYITIRTVKFHTGNIYNRIDVRSRSEAIVWVWKHAEIQKPSEY
jgi:DNA-binding NarL/FixJ family response regulator